MKGLELCKSYYENIGKPELFRIFPEVMGRAAAGLSGQGSDCLGLDDEFSRDHDFGPGFILWLTDADYEKFGAALQAAYDELPKQYLGFERRPTHTGAQRVGVMRTSDFYRYYIGCPGVPDSLMRWVRIQEHFLATCTSGEVFEDGLGEFSAVRNGLLPCYPEDVRLKKLAARAATMAQSGQYNFPRLMRREAGAGGIPERGALNAVPAQFPLRALLQVAVRGSRGPGRDVGGSAVFEGHRRLLDPARRRRHCPGHRGRLRPGHLGAEAPGPDGRSWGLS